MNLLIIDDDNICTFINNRVAETSGLFKEIHSAESGGEALQYFRKVCEGVVSAPDLILLDLNMPVMNGFDFVRALRELSFPNKENIAIVVLTSSEDSADLKQARSLGIDHYLIKPLTLNQLQTTIFSIDKSLWRNSLDC